MKTVVIRKVDLSDYYGWGGPDNGIENNCVIAKYLGKPVTEPQRELRKIHYKLLRSSSKEYSEYLDMIDNFDHDRANEKDIEILKRLKTILKMRLVIRK